jgi:hypothetical protein
MGVTTVLSLSKRDLEHFCINFEEILETAISHPLGREVVENNQYKFHLGNGSV